MVVAAPGRAYSLDDAGKVTAVTAGLAVGDTVTVNLRAAIDGVQHYRLASGAHEGQWVGLGTLRSVGPA